MKCKEALESLDALRTGELPAPAAAAVEQHVDDCPPCAEESSRIASFAEALRGGPRRDRVCDRFDVVEAPGHRLYVAFSSRGIRNIDLGAGGDDEFRERYRARHGRVAVRGKAPQGTLDAIAAALRGEPPRRLPAVDLSSLTEFERRVLETIVRIPRGEVRSYAWVARAAGNPRAVRAVGNVMASNPLPLLFPCHRVVPTAGGIGNYAFGPEVKREVLAAEGAPVEELETLGRKGIRYIGSKTTGIFCFPSCRDARRIREENRVPFRDAAEAARQGYRACLHCTPAITA